MSSETEGLVCASMNWLVLSIAMQILLALYLQIGEWVDLFPWNDLSRGNGQESLDVAMAIIQFGLVFGFVRRMSWVMGAGVGFYFVWIILQIQSWWVPYVWGASDSHMRFYQRWFGQTYKFLPTFNHHPAPDALHVVLQVLILVVVITAVVAFIQVRKSPMRGAN